MVGDRLGRPTEKHHREAVLGNAVSHTLYNLIIRLKHTQGEEVQPVTYRGGLQVASLGLAKCNRRLTGRAG